MGTEEVSEDESFAAPSLIGMLQTDEEHNKLLSEPFTTNELDKTLRLGATDRADQ